MSGGFMLVTTVKNEGPNILEWVAHHRVLGFEHIQVYQNDSTDGTESTLRTLARIGAIEYFRNHARPGWWQNKAYRRASQSETYGQARYCMALDGDEFLNIKAGDGSVQALVDQCHDPDAVSVNWRNFGSSGHIGLSEDLVTQRFTWSDEASRLLRRRQGFKTLFRTAAFERPGIHRAKRPVRDDPVWVNGSGIPMHEIPEVTWRSFDPELRKYAQVNHYPVRDLSSYLLKIARGSASHTDRQIGAAYWERFNRYAERDTTILRYADAVRAEMARLDALTDGRLFKLRRRSLDAWRRQVDDLLKDPQVRALRESLIAMIPQERIEETSRQAF